MTDVPPTKRQAQVHAFIKSYQAEHVAPPTLREISKHFKWKSPNSALEHLKLMERKGMVRNHGRKSRCWIAL